MEARGALYREVADLTIVTDDLEPTQVVDQALTLMKDAS
jgi:hypothetical protein